MTTGFAGVSVLHRGSQKLSSSQWKSERSELSDSGHRRADTRTPADPIGMVLRMRVVASVVRDAGVGEDLQVAGIVLAHAIDAVRDTDDQRPT